MLTVMLESEKGQEHWPGLPRIQDGVTRLLCIELSLKGLFPNSFLGLYCRSIYTVIKIFPC